MREKHVANGIIIDIEGENFLFQTRRKRNDGLFYLPGGWIENGEDHAAAIRRELKEELNISSFAVLEYLFNHDYSGYNSENKLKHWVFHVFLCLLPDFSEVQNNEPEKHDLAVIPVKSIPDYVARMAGKDLEILYKAMHFIQERLRDVEKNSNPGR
ncbi:MAG: NUDIX hydrolase [Rickettsiales bacterium]|jgi:8-oxo-dGTP pyrophosphatase MutT (NUDIX family)|nr:NUDIX hydrolase [Rickettsiales bacterium]